MNRNGLVSHIWKNILLQVSAAEITAPPVTGEAAELMPDISASFSDGLFHIVELVLSGIHPEIEDAGTLCVSVLAALMILSLIRHISGSLGSLCNYCAAVSVSLMLLSDANTMIQLGTGTVDQLAEYGKLLLPVMTTALAFQGGISTSTALYAGTAFFNALLGTVISAFMVPGIYTYLVLTVASAAVGEEMLKKLRDLIKQLITWCLKLIMTIFTTYMGITGVISGTTDAAALKATKVTISSFVPVVGSLMSDASETVLVSAGLAKNAAGIYGIFALLAIFLRPFLKIGIHYLFLKGTAGLSELISTKATSDLISDFSCAMGLVLAMTGTMCLLQLVSTVCFLRGIA